MTFRRTNEKRRHMASQHGTTAHVCRGALRDGTTWGCDKIFSRKDALQQHWKSKTGKNCRPNDLVMSTVEEPLPLQNHDCDSQSRTVSLTSELNVQLAFGPVHTPAVEADNTEGDHRSVPLPVIDTADIIALPYFQVLPNLSTAISHHIENQLNGELKYLPLVENLFRLERDSESRIKDILVKGMRTLFNECINQVKCLNCPLCGEAIKYTIAYKSHLVRHVNLLDFLEKSPEDELELKAQIRVYRDLKLICLQQRQCFGQILGNTRVWGCHRTFRTDHEFGNHLFRLPGKFEGSDCSLELKCAIREVASLLRMQIDVLERWRLDQDQNLYT
jgi:hypothetical protein